MENNSTYNNGSVPEYEVPIDIGNQKDYDDLLDEEELKINEERKHHC
ncbi:hypothetical protein ABWK22_17810 [Gottfriedia acidiceleris]|nr:hypothetical protein [Bacillus sp. AFS001701]